ncbi:hypothetical protein GRI62_05345 [Erythrobacter arachoides]|uniref:Hydrolase 2, exosortase A system-associated n=1 Tax=Aurantiacibacter arachoides TaxID=1850444 RepID=A0A845A656_9SPHN|nr:hypothetical protein [Aurantiacibacter arachoides]MXO93029.1 hypothetical protein [Aurantiacibacter arachoides]
MLRAAAWRSPAGGEELAVTIDTDSACRILIIPPLFDEHNKLRRFLIETMRALSDGGIGSVMADLPGTNESLQSLESQTLADWRDSMAACARTFEATAILAVRGGALVLPANLPAPLPTLAYAPVSGAAILRSMVRARMIADREAGRDSDREALLEHGRREGIDLAGYRLGPAMLRDLEAAQPADIPALSQADIGGAGLWLRAEPSHDAAQSAALAKAVAERLA